MNADIKTLEDGRFAVIAGRSDEITDPLIDRGDEDERELRAQYVYEAVNGQNAKSGEEISIPIPASFDGVERLLTVLNDDKQTIEATSIEKLEAEIDEAVYNLFELTDAEREIIEKYLNIF